MPRSEPAAHHLHLHHSDKDEIPGLDLCLTGWKPQGTAHCMSMSGIAWPLALQSVLWATVTARDPLFFPRTRLCISAAWGACVHRSVSLHLPPGPVPRAPCPALLSCTLWAEGIRPPSHHGLVAQGASGWPSGYFMKGFYRCEAQASAHRAEDVKIPT